MLRTETVEPGTLECLKDLMQDENLKDFFLVGGTALSLQIGHRISTDIDLFSYSPFDANEILEYLNFSKGFRLNYQDRNTLKGEIGGIQVDLITHSYPLIRQLNIVDTIRLASLEDIVAMKLNAIAGNGTRPKDFVDIASLSSHLSLKQMLGSYIEKYTDRNLFTVLKSINYTGDVDKEEPVQLISAGYSFDDVEKRIKEMLHYTELVFSSSPFS